MGGGGEGGGFWAGSHKRRTGMLVWQGSGKMFGINYVSRTLQVSPRATREHSLYFLLLRTVCEEIKKVFFVWRFSSFRCEDQLADVSLILEALSNTKIGFNNALTMHVYLRRAKLGSYLVYWTQMT